jgi:hypothetical protein
VGGRAREPFKGGCPKGGLEKNGHDRPEKISRSAMLKNFNSFIITLPHFLVFENPYNQVLILEHYTVYSLPYILHSEDEHQISQIFL